MERGVPIPQAVIGTVLGVVVVVAVVSYLAGRSVPFAKDDRSAVIALAIAGLVMCAFGIQTAGGSLGYTGAGMFVGAALGILLLVVFISALARRPVPVIGEYRPALIVMISLMGVKWLVSTASLVVRLAR